MTTMSLQDIERRITEVETSYQRQLAIAGKIGYDHTLTEFLKKDLVWLREQKANAAAAHPITRENKNC